MEKLETLKRIAERTERAFREQPRTAALEPVGLLDHPTAQAIEDFGEVGLFDLLRIAIIDPQPKASFAPRSVAVNQLDF